MMLINLSSKDFKIVIHCIVFPINYIVRSKKCILYQKNNSNKHKKSIKTYQHI
jgi:hypothetical protein